MPHKQGKKNAKHGRNRTKCERYLANGQRIKNNPARTGRKRERMLRRVK